MNSADPSSVCTPCARVGVSQTQETEYQICPSFSALLCCLSLRRPALRTFRQPVGLCRFRGIADGAGTRSTRVVFIHRTAPAATVAYDVERCLPTGRTDRRFEQTGAAGCCREYATGEPIAFATGVLDYNDHSAIVVRR